MWFRSFLFDAWSNKSYVGVVRDPYYRTTRLTSVQGYWQTAEALTAVLLLQMGDSHVGVDMYIYIHMIYISPLIQMTSLTICF